MCFIVQLDVLVNFGMLGIILWEYLCSFGGMCGADMFNLAAYGVRIEAIVQSSFAGEPLGEHPGRPALGFRLPGAQRTSMGSIECLPHSGS